MVVLAEITAQNYRYVNTVFSATEIITGVVYGKADFLDLPYVNESSTTVKDLSMDIYLPMGDTLSIRPAIVFAHGGGFLAGKRTVDDMKAFCDTFARKGYVAVTIDYRLGVEVVDNPDLHYARAVYRGLQDGRAAIRFLRANAGQYGIDPDHIYWGGNSAGSFIGLNTIYLDDNEKPFFAGEVKYSVLLSSHTGPDLGGLDIGDNLDYSGKPNAVMSCWGGLGDTLFIDSVNNTPVFLIHGTSDAIVPFDSGSPFNLNKISQIYGSNSINSRLKNLGIPAQQTYFVKDEGHGFYGVLNGRWINGIGGNRYWDTIVKMATRFYLNQHKPTAEFLYSVNDLMVDFTNMSKKSVSQIWDFGDGTLDTVQNPKHQYSKPGTYQVMLYVKNEMQSWDTLVQEIDISITSTRISAESKNKVSVYPNPACDMLNLTFTKPLKQATVRIYSIDGKLIANKKNLYGNQINLDLNCLEKGVYFIKVNYENKDIQIKIIKI